MSDETKCNCQHCEGHIAFPLQMVGQSIDCPHCGMAITLSVPTSLLEKHTLNQPKASNRINSLLLILICLVTCICAILFCLVWQRQPVAEKEATWEYGGFEFKSFSKDKVTGRNYKSVLIFSDSKIPESEFSADEILNRLANDGWILASQDGKHYTVKRKEGKWLHSSFRVEYMADQSGALGSEENTR